MNSWNLEFAEDCKNCSLETLRDTAIFYQDECRYLSSILMSDDMMTPWGHGIKSHGADELKSIWQRSLTYSHERMAIALAIYNERLEMDK